MKNKICFMILGLLSFWSCSPSNDRESKKDKEILKISTTKLNDYNDSVNNEQEGLKNKVLKLDSSESLVKEDVFSYSSINKDQSKYRLNMENGYLQMKDTVKQHSDNLNWETIDKVNISFDKKYQLLTTLKPKYKDDGDIYAVNVFVVMNKSNGDIFYKEQDAKGWENISTANLKICDNCYSFFYGFNINFFEYAVATNDRTNEVFNLIGHDGEITGRQSWIWEKGKCKEADWH